MRNVLVFYLFTSIVCQNSNFISLSTINFNQCPNPRHCICESNEPKVCSRCYDPLKNVSTQCFDCLMGARINNATGKCVPIVDCYSHCYCLQPKTCSICKDPKKNPRFNCSQCIQGYILIKGQQVCTPDPQCPKGLCRCDNYQTPQICTSCYDPRRNLSLNCLDCVSGFTLQVSNNVCLLSCPRKCRCDPRKPSVCNSCFYQNFNASTDCQRCNQGFYLLSQKGICIAEQIKSSSSIRDSSNRIVQAPNSYNTECLQGCVCDPSNRNCVGCLVPNFDPSTRCQRCFNTFVKFQNNCLPECTPNCNCVKGKCLSCFDRQYDVKTYCICRIGQKLNQKRVCI